MTNQPTNKPTEQANTNKYPTQATNLRVLGPESLVGSCTPRADDGQGHVELPARGRVRVAGAAQLGHAVDAEVGVHQLHDRPVPVHALSERLAKKYLFVRVW